jgi:hypothetical protein
VMLVMQSAERFSKVLRCTLGFLQAAAEPLHGMAARAIWSLCCCVCRGGKISHWHSFAARSRMSWSGVTP